MSCQVLLLKGPDRRLVRLLGRLRGWGYDASMVSGARGALELLEREETDLLILDSYLEEMLLHEFAEHAKHVNADCTIVAYFDQSQPSRPKGMYDPYVDLALSYDCTDDDLRRVLRCADGWRAGVDGVDTGPSEAAEARTTRPRRSPPADAGRQMEWLVHAGDLDAYSAP